MAVRHPLGTGSEWPLNFHDVNDDGLFILCGEKWPEIDVFWILEILAGELS
jgi:hypothetical protein